MSDEGFWILASMGVSGMERFSRKAVVKTIQTTRHEFPLPSHTQSD